MEFENGVFFMLITFLDVDGSNNETTDQNSLLFVVLFGLVIADCSKSVN